MALLSVYNFINVITILYKSNTLREGLELEIKWKVIKTFNLVSKWSKRPEGNVGKSSLVSTHNRNSINPEHFSVQK